MTITDVPTSAMPRRARVARIATWAALPVALLASGAIIGQSSYSASNATTSNQSNNWSAGTVTLSDDDSNTAMFTAANLKPGSTGSKCISVTSAGSLPSAVKLYSTNSSTTDSLSSYVDLAVTQGTGGSSGSCTGFTPLASGASVYSGTLAGFATSATGFSTGLGTWTPTGAAAESRTFQIVYTVESGTPNSAQGGTAAVGFTWEAQNS